MVEVPHAERSPSRSSCWWRRLRRAYQPTVTSSGRARRSRGQKLKNAVSRANAARAMLKADAVVKSDPALETAILGGTPLRGMSVAARNRARIDL